jgi:hypothetical protein
MAPLGLSSVQIENFIESQGGSHMRYNFTGVYPIDLLKDFIPLLKKFKSKKFKAPFCIANTDRKDQPGTHWIGFLETCKRGEIFLFDSFGENGWFHFIERDDFKFLKIFFDNLPEPKWVESKVDYEEVIIDELVFYPMKYLQANGSHIVKELSDTANGLIQMLIAYSATTKSKKLKIFVVKNQLQDINTSYCGIFQIYLFFNLFNPVISSKIKDKKLCDINTIKILLSELFECGRRGIQKNTELLRDFIDDYKIIGEFSDDEMIADDHDDDDDDDDTM